MELSPPGFGVSGTWSIHQFLISVLTLSSTRPLAIKKILDDAAENIELYHELTVADVWVDFGKARSDGLDQRGSVRVIQKPAAAAPERFPSVDQDWDAVIFEFERTRDSGIKKEAIMNRVSPIPEEGEDEGYYKGSCYHSRGRSNTAQRTKSKSPFSKNAVSERRHHGLLSSVEADEPELSLFSTDHPTIAGTPPQRAESEELGEWPSPAQRPRSISQIPDNLQSPALVSAPEPSANQQMQTNPEAAQSSSDEVDHQKASQNNYIVEKAKTHMANGAQENPPLATVPVPRSVSQASQNQPGVFDLGDSTEESDSSSEESSHEDDNNQPGKENTEKNVVQKETESDGSGSNLKDNEQNAIEHHVKEAHVDKSIANENGDDVFDPDGDVHMGTDHTISNPQTHSNVSRKRKQSLEKPISVKESRVEQAHPSTRQFPKSNSPKPDFQTNVLSSFKSKFPNGSSPHEASSSQTKLNSKVSTAERLVLPKPHAFCSPGRRANWPQEQEKIAAASEKNRREGRIAGMGLKFPMSPTSKAKAPEKAPKVSEITPKVPQQTPTFSSLALNQAAPSSSAIQHVYPTDSHDGNLKTTQEAKQGAGVKSKKTREQDDPKLKEQEKEELSKLQLLLERPGLDTELGTIATQMVAQLKRIKKLEVARRPIRRAKLSELREQFNVHEQKLEMSKSSPPKSSPSKPSFGLPPRKTLKELLAEQKEEIAARAATPAPAPELSLAPRPSVFELPDDSESESDSDDSQSGDIMPDGHSVKLREPWPQRS